MSEDKLQRQIEFIVDQQAKFSVDIAELKERQVEQAANIDKISDNVSTLADALLSLTNIVEKHDDHITALIQQGKEMNDRLNTLITVVERIISK